jgi:hypothetical protein
MGKAEDHARKRPLTREEQDWRDAVAEGVYKHYSGHDSGRAECAFKAANHLLDERRRRHEAELSTSGLPLLHELGLPARGYRKCLQNDIATTQMLLGLKPDEVYRWKGLGDRTFIAMCQALAEHGLSLKGDDASEWRRKA